MRYDRAVDIVRLAIRLQGTWSGLTLADIQREFEVSRRTAERLRDAVVEVLGPLEAVDTEDTRRHWRLRAPILRSLISLSAEELAELTAAAAALQRTGLEERALVLRRLADKLRALLETDARSRIEPDLQALTEAEGLAMRPGPRPRLDEGLLALLRDAISASREVTFEYPARPSQRAHAAARRALRSALRQPRLPDRPVRVRDGVSALAPGQHQRADGHRGAVHARRGIRPATVRPPVVRDVSGTAGRRGAALRRRGGRGCRRIRVPPGPGRGAER